MEIVELVDVEGVETVRSSRGTASRAREGDMLGDGEPGRWSGDVTMLASGLPAVSAMFEAAICAAEHHGNSRSQVNLLDSYHAAPKACRSSSEHLCFLALSVW